jgi:hypothetical protein
VEPRNCRPQSLQPFEMRPFDNCGNGIPASIDGVILWFGLRRFSPQRLHRSILRQGLPPATQA